MHQVKNAAQKTAKINGMLGKLMANIGHYQFNTPLRMQTLGSIFHANLQSKPLQSRTHRRWNLFRRIERCRMMHK